MDSRAGLAEALAKIGNAHTRATRSRYLLRQGEGPLPARVVVAAAERVEIE